jgi:hypothetical protein
VSELKEEWFMRRWLVLFLSFLAISCIESSKHYILNPDGSGKVMVAIKTTPFQGQGAQSVRDHLKDMLQGSGGVDVWADVSAQSLDDGRIHFKGTAYFKSIADVKIKNADDFAVKLEDVDKQTKRLVLSNKEEKKTKMESRREDMTLQEQRSKYAQMKPMLAAFLATMKSDIIVDVPGTVKQTINFRRDKNRLMLNFQGDKMMTALDELMADDGWLAEQVKQGRDIQASSPSGDALNEKLFGERGPVQAIFTAASKNAFDYAKEVEQAKTVYESMLAGLGLDNLLPVKLASGGQFKSLKVAKISLSDIDDDAYVHFGTSKRYQLTLLGELPGAVLNMTKGELRSATADNGDDLMPDSDWDREINWPQLSSAKNFVMFDVNLKLPAPGVQAVREMSGVVRYIVGSKTKFLESRLSFSENSAGDHGVTIEGIENEGEESVLKLEIEGAGHALKSVSFKDAAGRALEAREQSWSGSDDKAWYSFILTGPWPDKGSVVLEMYTDIKEYELPFSIGPVDLAGRSVK